MLRKIAATIFLFLISGSAALAYDDKTTHPALTGEILDFVGGFSAEERAWIIEGSKLEDTAPRWINHFYDPINNTAWTGAKAGNIPAETIRLMAAVGATEPVSATSWIKGCNTQSAYWANGGNQTWDKALGYAIEGKTKEAYIALGHILHVLEDMAVPDHTRDDTHAQALTESDGSPLEQYTVKYNAQTIKTLGIGASLRAEGRSPVVLASPEAYLEAMAGYSNKYFFSKDTINDPRYPGPKISSENDSFAYGKDENGTEFPLAATSNMAENENKYFIKNAKQYSSILDSYFIRLSKQAVLNGAGLVSLFKREFGNAPTNNEFNIDTRHTLGKIACQTGDVASRFNAMGIVSFIGQTISQGVNSAANGIGSAANSAFSFFAGLFRGEDNQVATIDTPDAPEESSAGTPNNPDSPAAQNLQQTQSGTTPPPPKPTISKTTTTPPSAPTSTIPKISTGTATSTKAKSIKLTAVTPPLPPPPQPTIPGHGPTGGGEGAVGIQPIATTTDSATSTDQQATTTPPSLADNVLISEIFFNADGSDAGKEFVELYNPSDSAKDLDGYSLKYTPENSTTTHSLATIRATTTEISIIPARGFLLFGFGGYDSQNYGGRAADITRSASLPNGEDIHSAPQKIKLSFFNETKQEIDSVVYDKNSITAPGQSLERMAFDSVCKSATGAGEFIGNGCSTGDKQFEPKQTPRPQNSKSFPEPRTAPTAPTTPEGRPSIATYLQTARKIDFAWKDASDFLGASEDIVYSLYDTSSSTNPLFISTSTATSTRIDIGEVGRKYIYSIIAEDKDGMPSATTSISTEVPGFADKIFFYHDPRAASAPGQVLLEIRYSDRRFIPGILSNGLGWRGLLFYLNSAPNTQNGTLRFPQNYAPQDPNGIIFTTSRGPALLGLSPENSKGFGPGLYGFSMLLPEEDGRLVLGATLPSEATSTDYATLAYYDAINTGGIAFPAGENDFGLIATDARKIYFSEIPPEQTSPTKPEDISVNFDENLSKLNVFWATSTDIDSPDSEITYEINFSTSTEFSSSTWVTRGKTNSTSIDVVYGDTYMVGARAVDDFGNASEPKTIFWSFPDGYKPVVISAPLTAASQDFVTQIDADISEINVYTASFSKRRDWPPPPINACGISFFEVDASSTISLLGASNTHNDEACAGAPLKFTFASPIPLTAGHVYRWQFNLSEGSNYFGYPTVKFYGRAENNLGGAFSDPSIASAKFNLKDTSGNIVIDN